jgi:hypothetical protein
MSVGSSLLTKDNLELVAKNSWKFGRPKVIDLGMRYYEQNPAEVQRIADNMAYMGKPNSGAALDEVLREIVIHYYEKLFVLVKKHEAYWIATNRVEMGDSLDPFIEARQTNKAVFIGQSHFGATYLQSTVLATRGYDLNLVGNFPEPVGSMLRANIATMVERYDHVGNTKLVNLAEGDADPSVHMIRCLTTKKIISNVFDENNQFCKEVNVLGKRIMGGTGMDLFLSRFSDEQVIVVTPFLIRTGEDSFRYEIERHTLAAGDIVESFYRALEKRLLDHFPQWYFIHELHESFPEDAVVNG